MFDGLAGRGGAGWAKRFFHFFRSMSRGLTGRVSRRGGSKSFADSPAASRRVYTKMYLNKEKEQTKK